MSKYFLGTNALVEVTLKIDRPMICGLIGQNGAGKSTLLKILSGDYKPSAGEIRIDGSKVEILNPRRALHLGIGIVYQEFSLLPNLSVADNISLGQEPTNGFRIDERSIFDEARIALARIQAEAIPLASKVADVSLAQRQIVEIAKVLSLRRPRILIFDEPTAALGRADVERLFRVMESLRDQGVTVIFVSHRYREVLEVCERMIVLRNGRVVAELDRDEASLESLVDLTVGQKTDTVFTRESYSDGTSEVVLEARGLSVGTKVHGVDFTVRRGEVVGVCGLLGSGQNELAACARRRRARRHGPDPRQRPRSAAPLTTQGPHLGYRSYHREPPGGRPDPRHAGVGQHQHCLPLQGRGVARSYMS